MSADREIPYSIPLNTDQFLLLTKADDVDLGAYIELREGWGLINRLEGEGWTVAKGKKVARSLYGILSVDEYPWLVNNGSKLIPSTLLYTGLYVPSENQESLKRAIADRGQFEKTFQDQDLGVLDAVARRNNELRQNYGLNWNPRFYVKEVARLSGKGRQSTRESLERLSGLLARATLQTKVEADNDTGFVTTYSSRWFLPTSHIPLAEELIQTYL